MRAFRRLPDAWEPVPAELHAKHIHATNDGYATSPESSEKIPNFSPPVGGSPPSGVLGSSM